MFWQASPYSWPVIGWPSDLNSYTLEEANRYFDIYYQPSNLVGVLVGDFDLETTKKMIVEYFGQLEAGSEPPPVVPTIEPTQKAQQRMLASVAAQSQVEIRYHAVPAGHSDGYALEIMSGVLNGKTGRLYKSMVQGEEIAANTRFVVDTKKYAGAVLFAGTVKGSATPKQLEAAWYEQVSLLQNEPVSKKELEKVKNNVIANQYRQLQSNFYLMIQLGYMEALGDWEYINYSGERLLEITTEDILNVANKYLQPENSSVAIYVRSKDAEPVDEDLERFNPQQQAMIKEALSEFNTMSGEELKAFLEMTKQQASQVPPEYKDVFDYITGKLQEKVQAISEISNGDSGSQD
jgi:predicted Zn-dependent peptidase